VISIGGACKEDRDRDEDRKAEAGEYGTAWTRQWVQYTHHQRNESTRKALTPISQKHSFNRLQILHHILMRPSTNFTTGRALLKARDRLAQAAHELGRRARLVAEEVHGGRGGQRVGWGKSRRRWWCKLESLDLGAGAKC
jgi:hypothetical protein